jgi:hypothetical protein
MDITIHASFLPHNDPDAPHNDPDATLAFYRDTLAIATPSASRSATTSDAADGNVLGLPQDR